MNKHIKLLVSVLFIAIIILAIGITSFNFDTSQKTGIIADGSYRIFGITDQNHIVDLSDCISIEQSATKSEGVFIIPLGY